MKNKKIIDYVMQSPNNTNPAVLESILETIISGGASAPYGVVAYFHDREYEIFDVVLKVSDTAFDFSKMGMAVAFATNGGETATNLQVVAQEDPESGVMIANVVAAQGTIPLCTFLPISSEMTEGLEVPAGTYMMPIDKSVEILDIWMCWTGECP